MLSSFRGRWFYDPLSEMNRLFEQVFGGGARRAGDGQRSQLAGWSPAIDVLQQDDDLVGSNTTRSIIPSSAAGWISLATSKRVGPMGHAAKLFESSG